MSRPTDECGTLTALSVRVSHSSVDKLLVVENLNDQQTWPPWLTTAAGRGGDTGGVAGTDGVRADDGCVLWSAREGRGEPLIVCHGGPGLWDMFGSLADVLGGDVQVVRWDQRG